MSKKWSRLGLKIKTKKNQKSKIALYINGAALGFTLVVLLWNTVAGESGDFSGMFLSMMAGIFAVPIVCALCGAGGAAFSVLALRRKESLKWSIPATVISGLLLFIGGFMTVRTFLP